MKRDILIGIAVAFALHGGLALSGNFFTSAPPSAPIDDTIPVIELLPPPPPEPELFDLPEPGSEGGGGGDLSDIVPPMQADNPAPTASSFVQRIQPPPPPGIERPTGVIVIPGRAGAGIGTGLGDGFKNLFDLATLDHPPVPRVQIRPVYPHEMSRAGINGEVLVGFIVDSEGNVRDPYVIRSTHREFEVEALRAAARWKFKPGRKNGADVSTRNVQLPFEFKLSGK